MLNVRSSSVQAALKRGGRSSSLSDHRSLERSSSEPSTSSSKKSTMEDLKTFERTSSDPLVAAEELENRLLAQCHVNEAYQTTTENFTDDDIKKPDRKGSPVKKSKSKWKYNKDKDDHSDVDKSISTNSKVSHGSKTDSGFESEQWAKKKGFGTNSGTWSSNPKDIVSMMQPDDTLSPKTDSSVKSNPVTPNRSRRRERKRRERYKRTEKFKEKSGIWSRGKQWARRHVLDKHIDDDTISSGESESSFGTGRYKSISELADQRQQAAMTNSKERLNTGPQKWEDIDLESSYIDPASIVSVPEMTTRMQHLNEHKDDEAKNDVTNDYAKALPNLETTVFVHRKDKEEETTPKPERSEVATARSEVASATVSRRLARSGALRRGQYSEHQDISQDVKISNLESEFAATPDTEYEDVTTQIFNDDDEEDVTIEVPVPVPAASNIITTASNIIATATTTKTTTKAAVDDDNDHGFEEDFVTDDVATDGEDDKAGKIIEASIPKKTFESYRQAYLDKVGGTSTVALTTTAGMQNLPYDVLSEMYLNEEIAAEKAAEEEKRKQRTQALEKQMSTPEKPDEPASAETESEPPLTSTIPSNKHTYLSLLNYAGDEETHCQVCNTVHYPICGSGPDDPRAPDPPPRPDIVEDTVRDNVPSTKKFSPTNESKSGQVVTPVQVSADDTLNDSHVYVNLDDVRPASEIVFANPPPLPPRQGSLPRLGKKAQQEWKTSSLSNNKKPGVLGSDSGTVPSKGKRNAETRSPMMQRKIQQFDAVKNESLAEKKAKFDSPRVHRQIHADIQERANLLKPKIDIQIQPATPTHKPSKLQGNEGNNVKGTDDVPTTEDDFQEETGVFERVGSVAERRKLFERPLVRGHQRASARTFTPQMTRGADRASTRSMDYQIRGKPGIALSVHNASDILPEQESTATTEEIPAEDKTEVPTDEPNKTSKVPQEDVSAVPISQRMAIFESANKKGSTPVQVSVPSKSEPEVPAKEVTSPGKSTLKPQPVPVAPVHSAPEIIINMEHKPAQVAKENKYAAGWKLHPDKLKIPDIFNN